MTYYLSGWRLALGIVLGVLLLLLVLSTILWLAALLAVVVAVAWLNLVLLPRVAHRLRLPRWLLDVVCLLLLGGVGWLLGGLTGLSVGTVGWLLAVAVPRVVGWRLRERMRVASSQTTTDVLELQAGTTRTDVWRYERRP